MNSIYLDYNATTPIAPEVTEAMRPYIEQFFGNPSSLHSYGSTTKRAIEKAREQLSLLINCDPKVLQKACWCRVSFRKHKYICPTGSNENTY